LSKESPDSIFSLVCVAIWPTLALLGSVTLLVAASALSLSLAAAWFDHHRAEILQLWIGRFLRRKIACIDFGDPCFRRVL